MGLVFRLSPLWWFGSVVVSLCERRSALCFRDSSSPAGPVCPVDGAVIKAAEVRTREPHSHTAAFLRSGTFQGTENTFQWFHFHLNDHSLCIQWQLLHGQMSKTSYDKLDCVLCVRVQDADPAQPIVSETLALPAEAVCDPPVVIGVWCAGLPLVLTGRQPGNTSPSVKV